jgi:hypothetical protein
MTQFAQNTYVSSERSQQEIERITAKYGANQFHYGRDDIGRRVLIGFMIKNISVQLSFSIPSKKDYELTRQGWMRSASQVEIEWQKGYRQRWRAMVLIVKAKLEAIESGISTIEREFLADVLLPDGRTISEALIPQLTETITTGEMPLLLSAPKEST